MADPFAIPRVIGKSGLTNDQTHWKEAESQAHRQTFPSRDSD